MQKYHRCDTIVFGEVLGHEKAFLIQNMCPITEKYMKMSIWTLVPIYQFVLMVDWKRS